jgi:hypothetical protein
MELGKYRCNRMKCQIGNLRVRYNWVRRLVRKLLIRFSTYSRRILVS